MNGITLESVEDYMRELLPARDSVLTEMEDFARRNRVPIVGPLVGRLLYQFAQFVRAGRVFEMGSAIGYSTIWFARALKPGGKVYYTDGSQENAAKAKEYIRRAGVADRVEILVGNALDLIDQVEGEFDVIFNDVDKDYYPAVYRKAANRVRKGGLLLSDNVLWSGRVADASVKDEKTEGVRTFNKLLYADERYYSTILPLRDGVAVGLRVG
jgi:predicted O-methyltransferase YrrM